MLNMRLKWNVAYRFRVLVFSLFSFVLFHKTGIFLFFLILGTSLLELALKCTGWDILPDQHYLRKPLAAGTEKEFSAFPQGNSRKREAVERMESQGCLLFGDTWWWQHHRLCMRFGPTHWAAEGGGKPLLHFLFLFSFRFPLILPWKPYDDTVQNEIGESAERQDSQVWKRLVPWDEQRTSMTSIVAKGPT